MRGHEAAYHEARADMNELLAVRTRRHRCRCPFIIIYNKQIE